MLRSAGFSGDEMAHTSLSSISGKMFLSGGVLAAAISRIEVGGGPKSGPLMVIFFPLTDTTAFYNRRKQLLFLRYGDRGGNRNKWTRA